jgi:hypothetical protein
MQHIMKQIGITKQVETVKQMETLNDLIDVIRDSNLVAEIYMEIDQWFKYNNEQFSVKESHDVLYRIIIYSVKNLSKIQVMDNASIELRNSINYYYTMPIRKNHGKWVGSLANWFKVWYDEVSGTADDDTIDDVITITSSELYKDINHLNYVNQEIYKFSTLIGNGGFDSPYKTTKLCISDDSKINAYEINWNGLSDAYEKALKKFYQYILGKELDEIIGVYTVFNSDSSTSIHETSTAAVSSKQDNKAFVVHMQYRTIFLSKKYNRIFRQ